MADDNSYPTADDALEPDSDQDGMYHPKSDEEHLEGDYNTPAAPADDTGSKQLPPDYPGGDSKPDFHETYDEGESDAEVDNRTEGPDNRPKPLE